MDYIKACKEHSKYYSFDGECVLESKASGGEPIMIKVSPDRIRAYRKHKPNIIKTGTDGEKIKMDTVPQLEHYFASSPVMEISKSINDNEFIVDFEAGFQRGRYRHQTREDLCNHLTFDDSRINSKRPWLSWIGLDCSEDLINGFTEGELEL